MSRQRLAMVVDAAACIDCKACQMACKVANRVPAGYWRNWIKAPDLEASAGARKAIRFQPGNCMHCAKPTCVEACPTGATYVREADGTVQIDRDMCIGCGQCLPACPYGARYRHPELNVADKCDFCRERRKAGLDPACVGTCPHQGQGVRRPERSEQRSGQTPQTGPSGTGGQHGIQYQPSNFSTWATPVRRIGRSRRGCRCLTRSGGRA